ncbi:hypothetical protein GGI42DRAFT_336178 [Trichoderma sp. SZMC 28013]
MAFTAHGSALKRGQRGSAGLALSTTISVELAHGGALPWFWAAVPHPSALRLRRHMAF